MNNTISGSQLELILEKNEAKAQELTLSWIDKWNQSKELNSSQSNSFLNSPSVRSQKFSSGFLLQPDLPYIVSVNDDRLSTGIMIFYIKDGNTILGKDENSSDIALNDKTLSEMHCIFQNTDSVVTLTPIDNSLCLLNNMEIKSQTRLTQGDVIKVGKYSFRFNHPEEAAKLRENEQEILNKNFLKSQSLPSLDRHNLTNEDGLLMAKFKTNNSIKMEKFDIISRSSSLISTKMDYTESQIKTKNEIKFLNNLKMNLNEKQFEQINDTSPDETNLDNQINNLNSKFHSEQISCKIQYDQSLKEFNEVTQKIDSNSNPNDIKTKNFDYDKYFYSTCEPDYINYINNFQYESTMGRLKQKFIFELKFFTNLKQLRLKYKDELNRINNEKTIKKPTSIRKSNIPVRATTKSNKNTRSSKQLKSNEKLNEKVPTDLNQSLPLSLPPERKSKIFDYNEELSKDLDISSISCPVLCIDPKTCLNCLHLELDENLERSKSMINLTKKANIRIAKKKISLEATKVNTKVNSSSNTNTNKNRFILFNSAKNLKKSLSYLSSSKRSKSVLKKPMKNTKQSALKRKLTTIKSLDCCKLATTNKTKNYTIKEPKDSFHTLDSELESRSSSSRAQSVESSRTYNSNKNSDDDCLNRKTKNLFKSSMNRIDNTHATFLNCLRDWNDPFLHGHKPIKPYGCQRCEGCACRSINSSNQSIHRDTCQSPIHTETERHYLNDTHSKLNRNFMTTRNHEFLTGFQPIIRCKSSANVPKTIDQCIKMSKSRPRPSSSNKAHLSRKCTNESSKKLNNSKMSTNSIESDKDSNDTLSKDDDFKILFQTSSPDSSMSQISKGTSELIRSNNEEVLNESGSNSKVNIGNETNTEMNTTEINHQIFNNVHDFSLVKHYNDELDCLENEINKDNNRENENLLKENIENRETNENNSDNNIANLLSSSTSSLIDNDDDIVYDDSLQDDSFESDSLMVDSETKQEIQTSFDEIKNVNEFKLETNKEEIKSNQENTIINVNSSISNISSQGIMSSEMDFTNSNKGESLGNKISCKHQNRQNPIQRGFKDINPTIRKRRKSLSDSIEDLNKNHLINKKTSPNRSYSESYLLNTDNNNNNDTDIDEDFDCSNCDLDLCDKIENKNLQDECQFSLDTMQSDLNLNEVTLSTGKKLSSSTSFEKYKILEKQPSNPVSGLEDQIKFYERVKDSFFTQLDKSLNLTPPSSQGSSPSRRRSTSNEQKFLSQSSITSNNSDNDNQDKSESTRIVFKFSGDIVGGEKCPINEFSISSRSSSRSSSFSKKSFEDEKLEKIAIVCQNEAKMPTLYDSLSVPTIIVHETKIENDNNNNNISNNNNEKSIENDENIGNHDNQEKNLVKQHSNYQIESELVNLSSSKITIQENLNSLQKRRRSFKLSHQENDLKNARKSRNNKLPNFSSFFNSFSPMKKRAKMNESDEVTKTQSMEANNLDCLIDELKSYEKTDEEDEFFLAISSSSLQTGSCPEFYWYPTFCSSSLMTRKRNKSENDLVISSSKSYENITQSNYVQMINSMINGAISDMADPEYVDYLKRHIQGLFDNFTPVLMKSKSNEEIAMTSPSRDKISQILNQTMPKSFSFDFKFLEDSKLNQSEDVMDFTKFGLGIKDHESSDDESMNSDELNTSFIENNDVENLIFELVERVSSDVDSKNFNFELNELKSSTKINFDDQITDDQNSKLSNSLQQNSMNDDSTPFGSESYASTIVNVNLIKNDEIEENNISTESPSTPSAILNENFFINQVILSKENNDDKKKQFQESNEDENVNLLPDSDSDSEDFSETRRLIQDSDSDSDESTKKSQKENIIIDSSDDLIIECKINYKMKNSDSSDSSFSDSDSDSESKKLSDYDNLGQKSTLKRVSSSSSFIEFEQQETENTGVLSTSLNSIESNSNQNLVNETLASLTSMTDQNRSIDEEEEPEYNMEDFHDLDENWMHEDDPWDSTTTDTIQKNTIIHMPRLLDPIEEEDDSDLRKKSDDEVDTNQQVDKDHDHEQINLKQTEDLRNMFENVEQFKISFEYKYKGDCEKFRSQNCDLDTLLGSTSPAVNDNVFSLLSTEDLESTKSDPNTSEIIKEDLSEKYEEIHNDLYLEVEANYGENSISETSLNEEENNQTITEKYEEKDNGLEFEVETKFTKIEECIENSTLIIPNEELQKDSVLEVETKYGDHTSESENSFEMDQTVTEHFENIKHLSPAQNENLTEKFEEIQKDSVLDVETKYSQNYDDTGSDSSWKEESPEIINEQPKLEILDSEDSEASYRETIYSHLEIDTYYQNEIKSDDDDDKYIFEKSQDLTEEINFETKPIVIEENKFENLTESFEEITEESHFKVETEYTQDNERVEENNNFQVETNYTSKIDEPFSEDEEVHVEYFEYVISKDMIANKFTNVHETFVPDAILSEGEIKNKIIEDDFDSRNTSIVKNCESELDLSKLHLSLKEEDSFSSDKLKEVLSDIEKEIKENKSPVLSPLPQDENENKFITKINATLINKDLTSPRYVSCSTETDLENNQDKCYQVNPSDLDHNMVDSHTQSTPPLSPIKKLTPLKKNASTETDESEIFSNYLIKTEEQKLRKKLEEKENSLKLTTIATQTENDKILIESLDAKENIPITRPVFEDKSNIQKIMIVNNNDNTQNNTNLKLNYRQKIKIQNLDNFKSNSDEFYQQQQPPSQIKTTHLKTIDIQTEPETRKESRSRSVSNSSTFIDLLSLNLDRSKTWVELTEAKLNYMIGETDAVLRSMNLDSSDDESKKPRLRNLSIDTSHVQDEVTTPRSQSRLTNQSRTINLSINSPRIHLISPDHTLSCLASTTKTIEEMTQVYLDNYKRQLEDSKKEMYLLEMEKEKISKIRDLRKRELYMRRQAAIEAFRLEREREMRNSHNDELINSHNESVVYDDLDDHELNRTFTRNSKLNLANDLPSQNREKLARLRRDVVMSSTGMYDDVTSPRVHIPVRSNGSLSSTPRINEDKSNNKKYTNNIEWTKRSDSRLLIPVQKTYIEETTETRIERTTSSSSNSSSIIDESRLLLKEYEQLRNDSVSEIQRAHDSLNASLLWLENQKLNRLRSLQENKSRDNSSSYSTPAYSTTKSTTLSKIRNDENRPDTGRLSRTDSTSSYKPIKTRELSPVTRFREEQKEYLLRVNTSNTSTSNSNTNRKEIPISIYSPLSSSSFMSNSSTSNTKTRNTTAPASNNKIRIDQVSKSNTTTITISDYSTKINPSNQS
ncbi:unnamed protein product, partial [Brachionus calyciflorus]